MQQTNRKYLVCVDGRDECKIALRLACMKAAKRGGKVSMLHIVPPADFQTLGAIADKMREERISDGKALLISLCAEAENNFELTPETILLEGSAGDKIVEAAMNNPDVIMIALGVAPQHHTGRGKLTAWLVGQLGGALLVPVLLVPNNLTDQQLATLI